MRKTTLSKILQKSQTHQYTLQQGALSAFRELVVLLGTDRFGPPSDATRSTITAIRDLDRLKRILRAVSRMADWDELLAVE